MPHGSAQWYLVHGVTYDLNVNLLDQSKPRPKHIQVRMAHAFSGFTLLWLEWKPSFSSVPYAGNRFMRRLTPCRNGAACVALLCDAQRGQNVEFNVAFDKAYVALVPFRDTTVSCSSSAVGSNTGHVTAGVFTASACTIGPSQLSASLDRVYNNVTQLTWTPPTCVGASVAVNSSFHGRPPCLRLICYGLLPTVVVVCYCYGGVAVIGCGVLCCPATGTSPCHTPSTCACTRRFVSQPKTAW